MRFSEYAKLSARQIAEMVSRREIDIMEPTKAAIEGIKLLNPRFGPVLRLYEHPIIHNSSLKGLYFLSYLTKETFENIQVFD